MLSATNLFQLSGGLFVALIALIWLAHPRRPVARATPATSGEPREREPSR
jgi:hypothetical protein